MASWPMSVPPPRPLPSAAALNLARFGRPRMAAAFLGASSAGSASATLPPAAQEAEAASMKRSAEVEEPRRRGPGRPPLSVRGPNGTGDARMSARREPKRPRVDEEQQGDALLSLPGGHALGELDAGGAPSAPSKLRAAAVKAAQSGAWLAGAAKEAAQDAKALAEATRGAMSHMGERAIAEEAVKVLEVLAEELTLASSSGMALIMQVQDAMVRAAHLHEQSSWQSLGQRGPQQSSPPHGRAPADGPEEARRRWASAVLGSSPSSAPSRDLSALMLGATRRAPPPSAADPEPCPEPPLPRRPRGEAAPKRHPLKLLNRMTGCKLAEWRSERSLAQASRTGRRIRDTDVTFVLDAWKFRKNQKRLNVIPDGKTFVNSEMLGLVSIRAYRKLVVARQSAKYPMVTKLLCQYVYDNPPPGLQKGEHFPFTTICVNKDYAAKRHRDKNNTGLSIVRALGNFKGGRLRYWPDDPGPRAAPDVDSLDESQAVVLDVRGRSVALDSTKAHEVEAFEGRRYSLVYFTVPWVAQADEIVRMTLKDHCGLQIRELVNSEAVWRCVRQPARGRRPDPHKRAAVEEPEPFDDGAQPS